MHNAPPVAYPLGRSHFQGLALAGLWLAGLLVTIGWWLAAAGFDWRIGMAMAAVVAAGLAAWLGWRSAPVGQLHWDGQVWRWESQDSVTPVLALSVALDLQRTLLLRLDGHEHATLWLWAHRTALPERWLDLRRAVYSRRKAWSLALPPDVPTAVAAADFPAETDPPRPYP